MKFSTVNHEVLLQRVRNLVGWVKVTNSTRRLRGGEKHGKDTTRSKYPTIRWNSEIVYLNRSRSYWRYRWACPEANWNVKRRLIWVGHSSLVSGITKNVAIGNQRIEWLYLSHLTLDIVCFRKAYMTSNIIWPGKIFQTVFHDLLTWFIGSTWLSWLTHRFLKTLCQTCQTNEQYLTWGSR